MKKSLSLLLASVILVCAALTSCSEKTGDETTAQKTGAGETVETGMETETETEEPDRFADVDYGGKTFTVYTSVDTVDATNGDRFIRGTGEYNGEAVNDAVYDRNLKVSDLIDINLEYVEANYNYNDASNQIKIQIQAGDPAWDVIANDIRALATLSANGFIANFYGNDILDFSKDYWYTDSMNNLSFLEGGMYLLVGDYFTDALASCHTLYANEEILNNIYNDYDYVNKMVFDGKWTIDEMTRILNESYKDTDGDGKKSNGDDYGYASVGMWGPAIPMLIGLDINFVEKTADSVQFAFNNEHSVAALDKLHDLYYSEGTISSLGDVTGLRSFFANKQVVFMGYNRLGDLAQLRDIEFEMGVLPYPKFDENQEGYITTLHDTSEIGAIPSTTVGDNLTFTLTCLEVLARETGSKLIPVFYEDGLKVKYADGLDDAKMIDLIHDSITSPFAVAYDSTLGNFLLRNVFLDPLGKNNINFASSYDKYIKSANKLLERTTESFRSVLEESTK